MRRLPMHAVPAAVLLALLTLASTARPADAQTTRTYYVTADTVRQIFFW